MATLSAQIVRMAVTIVSGPILSRLVGPATYGILAPSQSVSGLGNLVADSGFAYHTVTDKQLTREQAKDIYWQSIWFAFGVGALAGLAAGCMGHVPIWQRGVRALCGFLGVFFSGITAVPNAWGQRTGQMGKLEWGAAIFQALSTLLVAIPMALGGAKLMGAGANLYVPLMILAVYAWRISGFSSHKREKAVIGIGYRAGVLAVSISSYLAGSIDILATSMYLPIAPLGIYSRASLLSSLPGNAVGVTLSRVGLVSLSKAVTWTEQKRYLIKANLIVFVLFTSFAIPSFLGFDLMRFAFGMKFTSSPIGFAILTLSQPFFYGSSLIGSYLIVRQRFAAIAVPHFVQAVVSTALFVIFKPTSLAGIGTILLTCGATKCIYLALLMVREDHVMSASSDSTEETPSI